MCIEVKICYEKESEKERKADVVVKEKGGHRPPFFIAKQNKLLLFLR